jgi:hypothetical protein
MPAAQSYSAVCACESTRREALMQQVCSTTLLMQHMQACMPRAVGRLIGGRKLCKYSS